MLAHLVLSRLYIILSTIVCDSVWVRIVECVAGFGVAVPRLSHTTWIDYHLVGIQGQWNAQLRCLEREQPEL